MDSEDKEIVAKSKHRKTKAKDLLADPLPIEREWGNDHEAQLAALRLVLSFPARPVVLNGET